MLGTTPRRVAIILFVLSAGGCGAAANSANGSTSPAPAHHDRTTISADELRESQAQNLYEVVQRLHPEWLTARGVGTLSGGTPGEVNVYLGTQRAGTSDYLRQQSVNSASALHYFTASEAQSRFGNGNGNGVIQIVSSASRPSR